MNRKEFEESFWNREHTFNLDDVWQWIEQYGTEQRIDENKKDIEFLKEQRKTGNYISKARLYVMHIGYFENRIKDLNETP